MSGLDLVIGRHEAHALLGGSGAGKTTLVNLLSGLLTPSAGQVLFDGHDVSRVAPRDRGVAQVFQFPVLYPSLTVGEILALPLCNRGWKRQDARLRAADIAGRLQFSDLLDRRSDGLSLFQKQLVSIGRALVRPDIALVLLDEPLTAVEPATKWQLRGALKAIQGELGATMVYVTHDQTEALTFADRISVMHDGRILQTGTPEDLYERPDHEHVAHFIGSPGMNMLPGRISDGAFWLGDQRVGSAGGLPAGPCTLGFRPEWATLEPSFTDAAAGAAAGAAKGAVADAGAVTVTGSRALGVEHHRPVGIVTAELNGRTLHTRQPVDLLPGKMVRLKLDAERLLAFREGWRLKGTTVGVADGLS